ncbi:MAG: asparagine synthase (glutamine-hydrolyzing) [Coriobacteriia bacterium]|nr:asparagine synthase (glutamine-hydrolyzing) [Coriobacteriia bacterium]
MSGFVGIAGELSAQETTIGAVEREANAADTSISAVLERMMDRIIHRGPDAAGTFISEHVALGFRQLGMSGNSGIAQQPLTLSQTTSALQLQTSDQARSALQPLSNSLEDNTIVLVCNGEILNAPALRVELEAEGHIFATQTSVEVLLHGYEQWGKAITERLRGFFAFVIYDRKRETLFGARDFFGIKPFYYTRLNDGSLLFGSEIKAFLEHPGFSKQLNERALKPYLSFQYSVLEETFFKGVFRLPPAHRFTFELSTGTMVIERYWDVDFSQSLPPALGASRSLDECIEALDKVVNESVRLHRVADAPVGALLSGGIDSSYVTSALKPDKTFSVGFINEGYDETNQARDLSDILGIENFRYILDPADGFEAFPTIQYHIDEPLADPSIVPLYFLNKMTRQHVSHALSGEGGDELFAGYELYDEPVPTRKWKRRVPAPVRRGLATLVKPLPRFKGRAFLLRGSGRPEDYFIGQVHIFDEREATALVKPKFRSGPSIAEITAPIYQRVAGWDELSKKQYLDMNLWLPGAMLLKGDKMSMAHSLDLRAPLLDIEVMKEAQSAPQAYRITEENTKCVLRAAAAHTLPAAWANRVKTGFLTPIRFWLKEDRYYERIRELFASEIADRFFDCERLLALLNAHHEGKANNGRKIWTVYSFLVWYQRFFVDEVA